MAYCVTSWFPSLRASNAETVSMWRRCHEDGLCRSPCPCNDTTAANKIMRKPACGGGIYWELLWQAKIHSGICIDHVIFIAIMWLTTSHTISSILNSCKIRYCRWGRERGLSQWERALYTCMERLFMLCLPLLTDIALTWPGITER